MSNQNLSPFERQYRKKKPITVITLPVRPPSRRTVEDFRRIMFALHNQIREHYRLPQFGYDFTLQFLAQKQTGWMSERDLLKHTEDLGRAITNARYVWGTVGENVAYHTWTGDLVQTAEAIFYGWMTSPGHRKNILNPNFREIGIGFWVSESGLGFSTVIFGTRRKE